VAIIAWGPFSAVRSVEQDASNAQSGEEQQREDAPGNQEQPRVVVLRGGCGIASFPVSPAVAIAVASDNGVACALGVPSAVVVACGLPLLPDPPDTVPPPPAPVGIGGLVSGKVTAAWS